MATAKRKSTFGSSYIDHFSPALPEGTPKAVNVILSFEEALTLHVGLGQLLGHQRTDDANANNTGLYL